MQGKQARNGPTMHAVVTTGTGGYDKPESARGRLECRDALSVHSGDGLLRRSGRSPPRRREKA